ncbi:MAG: DUF4388 domain-containing protein [Candidatus Aminicenantia bacterium]
MALQGSLEDIHLSDLVQLVGVTGKTGRFVLRKGDEVGIVYIENGNIVHAESGNRSGEDAFYYLSTWDKGDFNFEANVKASNQTITKSFSNLLIEAARRMDEWKILKRKIPSESCVPEFIVFDAKERRQINLTTLEWMVVSKIDGRRTVEEIAKECNMSLFDTTKILYGLAVAELVKIKTP